MMPFSRLRVVYAVAVLAIVLVAACSQQSALSEPVQVPELVAITIQPSSAALTPNTTQTFQAIGVMENGTTAAATVTWEATGGTIDENGVYVSPTDSGAYQIVATHTERSWLSDTAIAQVTLAAVDVGAVEVTPGSAALQVGRTLQLSATVYDTDGNALPDWPVSWSSNNSTVASVFDDGFVTAGDPGSALIAATSGGTTGTAALTVTNEPPADLAEPVYDPNNPDHVLHFYDNFANYATPSEMEQMGTNPDRVGGTWQLRGYFQGGFDEADPYTGEQSVRIYYPDPGSARRNDGGISIGPADYVNETGDEDVIVIEYAYREIGPNTFRGKIVDFNAGWNNSSIGRFDFNNGVGWPMGGQSAATCSADPLCSRYYAGNDDNDLTPRFAGLPPESGRGIGDPVRYVQLRTEGNLMPTIDPNDSFLQGYRQNRNWGMGAGQFDWMNNRDMLGQGNPSTEMPWMVIKERFTKESVGGTYGEGRIEHWAGQAPGSLIKIIEYVGDAGRFDEGTVFVGPRNRSFFSANLNFMWPQGIGSPANTNVLFGYVRVWSHPRP